MRTLAHCGFRLSVFVCIVLLWSAQPGLALVVSEIMYHPIEDPVTGEETLEFIELYNDRAVSEDLGGWAFTSGIRYTFAPDTILGPKSYLVIARDPDAVMEAYGITGVLGPYDGRLSNSGEQITLSNTAGGIVLSFSYSDEPPWPVSPDGAGHSLTLAKLGGDPDQASSWAASTFIGGTPGGPDQSQVAAKDPTLVTLIDLGHPGRYFKGTEEPSPDPAGQPTIAWTAVDFDDHPAGTDWLEGPSGYGYSNDPAELAYIETQLNDMRGGYMSIYARLRFTMTAAEIASFTQLLAEVVYDDGFVLYLNGVRVGDSGNLPGDPPAFDRTATTASDYPPLTVDLTGHMDLLLEGTNVLAVQAHNVSLSGSSDAFIALMLRGIIQEPDTGEDPHTRVVVNEIMAASSANDWIELYNPGPATIDLSNVYLSNDRRNLLAYKIPDGVVLYPGQFWAVRRGTPPDGFPFSLDFRGGTVYVTAAAGAAEPEPVRVIDALRYGGMEPDRTFGRYPNGSNSFDFLSKSTFGGPNAPRLIRDIVINEIMYQHAMREQQFEYVELYNQGTRAIPLAGWAFTDGISYTFPEGAVIEPDSYVVVGKDPDFLAEIYDNLTVGSNLFGPYGGRLSNSGERIRLSFPHERTEPDTGRLREYMVTADEVTYFDGDQWPRWADGRGASLELRDPRSHNDTPGAWAASDESEKSEWTQFSYTIDSTDNRYTHDTVTMFDLMLLSAGEVLLDDLELIIDGSDRLTNGGFEAGTSSWRIQGNHVRSFVTTDDRRSGSRALHLVATGRGDPGANRINQSISNIQAGTVTFRGWARWLRGSRFLLLRTSRELSPVQPPRPAYAFELDMPLALGTPGRRNTAFVANRGPDILDVKHAPVLPQAGEPIVVTARIEDNDGVAAVTLYYRSEGKAAFTGTPMVDDGSGDDLIAGDGLYTATIPGAGAGTMRAFYIEATDGSASARFPTMLEPSADVPERTCLVRVGDTLVSTQLATYRVWMSDAVIDTFRSRQNLSNELLDCTFVYNNSKVFYNCGIRYRGSPFIRPGANRDPRDRRAYRIKFPADNTLRGRGEINLDNTEGSSRGPLQERASYWFYEKMGLQYSRQEWVRVIINGRHHANFEDVQKVDNDYLKAWFPDDRDGYLHKVDDYFEFNATGTSHSGHAGDEGLIHGPRHPLIPETYRWGFEKRSHRQDDNWQHLFDFAVAMNTPSSSPGYEQGIEHKMDPRHFTKVLAIRHAVGDWDSYGYNRGKNNYFYYALPEGKWYLLPWDIDFTLGSGHGPNTDLFTVAGHFPEVRQFLNHLKYRQMYLDAFREMVEGPWSTSFGTNNPPTAFDRFLDDAADVLVSEGLGDGRRNGIKQFVRARRDYILTQLPAGPAERPQ